MSMVQIEADGAAESTERGVVDRERCGTRDHVGLHHGHLRYVCTPGDSEER